MSVAEQIARADAALIELHEKIAAANTALEQTGDEATRAALIEQCDALERQRDLEQRTSDTLKKVATLLETRDVG